jgi:CubicO group peptidase (beta-lactamase class C family)
MRRSRPRSLSIIFDQEGKYMYGIPKLLLSVITILSVAFTPAVSSAESYLDSLLRPYLSKYGLPAVAAAVVKNGKTVTAGAVGKRRVDSNIPVTMYDRFHVGSNTKAMTALLAAIMVEEGKLNWTSTIAGVFPELAGRMDAGLGAVTLEQLLSHTSGIPGDNDEIIGVYIKAMSQEGNLDEMRYWLVGEWGKRPPATKPGAQYQYSNMGYTIAGAMIERSGKKTWDELIMERVFKPMNLKTAGLGPQASPGRTDAPMGHAMVNGKIKVLLSGPNGDAPPIIGPAGIVHMSVLDFARWAAWNAGEGKRGPGLVKPAIMKKLHTPVINVASGKDASSLVAHGRYAFGWVEARPDWSPDPILYHSGSNGMNLAHIWVDTKRDFAMVLLTNIGGDKAKAALDALARELYPIYMKK